MSLRKNNFTLLEICIAVAILAASAITVGWQMKNMVASHHFDQNISNLITDLKKCQLLALADRIDIEVKITKNSNGFAYTVKTDEPRVGFLKTPKKIAGVIAIRQGDKEVTSISIPIYASGRIEKKEKIRLYQDEEKGIELDFSRPHLIAKRNL